MSITIYIADDHAVIRDGLRHILGAKQQFEVVGEAGDGRTAVEDSVRLKPDIVIMDIAMPGLNGIEAADLIREQSPATKVIMLSMYGDPEHVFRALKAGAKGFVLKDSAGTEVCNAVMSVHKGRRFFCRGIDDVLIEDYIRQRSGSASIDPLAALSSRERQTFHLVAEGKTTAEIAELLKISPKSVDTYRSRLMNKLGLQDMSALIKFAVRQNIVDIY